LDGGPIIAREEVNIMNCKCIDDVVNKLRKTSIDMWINTLKALL
jgi:methionyl-tRNA formyltransferase